MPQCFVICCNMLFINMILSFVSLFSTIIAKFKSLVIYTNPLVNHICVYILHFLWIILTWIVNSNCPCTYWIVFKDEFTSVKLIVHCSVTDGNCWTDMAFCWCTVAGVDNKTFIVIVYLVNMIYILKICEDDDHLIIKSGKIRNLITFICILKD